MRCKVLGLWAFLVFAVVVHAQPSAFFANASGVRTLPFVSMSMFKPAVEVKGKVVDGYGKGVANADVSFSGPMKAKTTTDSQGSFTYEVSPGKYTITAKSGTKSTSIEIEIESDTSELSLILE